MLKRVILLLSIIIVFNLSVWYFTNMRLDDTERMIGLHTGRVSSMISRLISRIYYKDFENIVITKSNDSGSYENIKNLLRDCRDTYDFRFIFSFYMDRGSDYIVYVVDSESVGSPYMKSLGEVKKIPNTLSFSKLKKNPGNPVYDIEAVTTEGGHRSISGYSPIFRGEDRSKILGYVEVSADEGYINDALSVASIRFLYIFSVGNIFLFSVFLTYMGISYYQAVKDRKKCEKAMELISKLNFSEVTPYELVYEQRHHVDNKSCRRTFTDFLGWMSGKKDDKEGDE